MSTPLDPESKRLLARMPGLVDSANAHQLVTVLSTAGSAPRAVGARMLCRQGQLIAGTIGGGHLEERALEDAEALAQSIESGLFRGQVRRYPLGPELAQCCGGVVELLYEAIDEAVAQTKAADLAAALACGGELRTEFDDGVLVETPQPEPTVVICGAGHVSAALAAVLSVLPWRVIVADHRRAWADRDRFPAHHEIFCCEPLRLFAAWGWLGPQAAKSQLAAKVPEPPPSVPLGSHTAAVVMTHDHDIDRDLADALLRLSERAGVDPLRYVGVIGSKTKIATLRQRLRGRGVGEDDLGRLTAPIGLRVDGKLIGSKLPGQIAVSVAAQLIEVMADGGEG